MFESMETVAAIFVLAATIWLSLGLGLAYLLKKQPARAHGILVVALMGTLITPVLYFGIQQANWGLLPSGEEVTQSPGVIHDDKPPGFFDLEPVPAISLKIPRLEPVGELVKELSPVEPVTRFPEVIDRAEPVVRAIPDSIVAQDSQTQVVSKFSLKGLLLWGWFGATAVLVLRLGLDFLAGHRLARKSRPLGDASTVREIEALAHKLGLYSPPLLALSDGIPSPVLWGWSRPARILVPATAGASPAFQGVYLHELAHLARRDHLSAFFGEVVCCLIPWHPLVWWTKRSMEARAEEACDDWAIAGGCQAADYAEELVKLAPSRAGALAMAAVSKGSRLKMRVSRLLQGAFSSPRLGRGWVLAVGLTAFAFTGLMSILQPRVVHAEAGESKATLAESEHLQGPQTVPLATSSTAISVMAEGKPVEGAKVWVMVGFDETGGAKFLESQKSDAKGRTQFSIDPAKVQAAYALDQQGRVAVGPMQEGPNEISRFLLSLERPQSIEAVVTHLGKPVAGVAFEAGSINFLDTATGSVPYPPGFPESIVQSDEMGRVRFTHLPRKAGVSCQIADSRFAWCGVYLNPDTSNNIELVEGGGLRFALEGAKEPFDLKETYWSLSLKNQENKAVFWNRFSESKDKNNPSISKNLITHIAPGEYTLSFSSRGSFPYTFGDPQTVLVEKGKIANVAIPVKKAALIKGRLVDSESGEGVPHLRFNLQSTSDKQGKREQIYAQTDEKGYYRVYVRGKAHYGIAFFGSGMDSDRYQPPPYDPKTLSNGVHGEVGEEATVTFPDMSMTRSVVLRGKILNQTNLESKEEVQVFCPIHGSKNPGGMAAFSTQDGGFQISGIPSGISLSVRIRQGKAVNIPESLTPAQWADAPKLSLSEANGVTFVGTVQNQQGKPLPRAKVKLFWNYPIQGRDSELFTSKLMEVAETDKEGRFRCMGYWPSDRFYLMVECEGYQPTGGDFNATKKGEPGDTVDFGTFRLTRSSASIQGKAIGLDGNGIRGLVVRAAGHTGKPSQIQTNAMGQFQVNQLPEGPGILIVQGSGFRSTFAPFHSGEKEFTMVVRRLTDPPSKDPVIADAYLEARKKMLRHMLESLWKTRAENGWGRSIFESMNQFDPVRTREWVNQVPPQEKMQWQNTIALSLTDDQIIKITKENVEDGIAAIRRSVGRSGRNPSRELSGWGEKFLNENKEIAIRLAEEAALSARQFGSNETVWKALSLAEAGELAWRAGNQTGGRKLIDEGIESLKKNPRHRLFEVSCGRVASCLAIIDWPEAKKILDLSSDPGYFNIGLSACLKKMVVTDSDKAIKNLDLIKEDRSFIKSSLVIYLARTIASKDFAKALTLMKGLEGQAQYSQGLVEIALQIHPADPRKAHKLIEQAFDYLDSHESAFYAWSNYGGRPVLAAQIVYFARKMNYPDLNSLIARSLGYLGEHGGDEPERRKQQGLLTAYALAFSDPVTAKGLAEMHSSMEALSQEWSKGGRRGKGFLLAMIDPEKAMVAFDSMAAVGWNSQKVSHAGLSELIESFTKPGDLMENMTRWESLVWRSLERD